uniref:SCAN box domain-containing protein n=1 Tax=Poecilia mexicana TaxID=48701 RepID=A0A3B3WC71_9TELE
MSVPFNLEHFLANPSLELIHSCRKCELLQIVEHFKLQVPKQVLKRDLKALVVGRLMETGVIKEPDLPEAAAVPSHKALSVEDLKDGSSVEVGVSERGKTPRTLPRYDPLSSVSSEGRDGARLKVRLARLQMEAEEKAQDRKAQLELEIRRLEIEAEKAIQLRKLELEAQTQAPSTSVTPSSTSMSAMPFNISKCISLVPVFRESEVDSYFAAFERIAGALQWPRETWPLLLQCKFSGKAQEVLAALPLKDSLDYDLVKAAVLQAYELVPEAYRQKFRQQKKTAGQTHVEFAREKGILFDKWCAASKVNNYDTLRELILLEDFKKCIPDRVVLYLNEQKVTTLASAAVLADEYVLTHKSSFIVNEKSHVNSVPQFPLVKPTVPKESRECFYCHKSGHVIVDCLALKRKSQPNSEQTKGVVFVKKEPHNKSTGCGDKLPDPCFEPFIFDGLISLASDPSDLKPVHILRDTGCSQSIILSNVLPFSPECVWIQFCSEGDRDGLCSTTSPQSLYKIKTCHWVFPYCCMPRVAHKWGGYANGERHCWRFSTSKSGGFR